MPDDVVADRGDLFIGVCVGEWRHRVVATKRSDPDAFKYGADNICAGGVNYAFAARHQSDVGLVRIAVPTQGARASRSEILGPGTVAPARPRRTRRGGRAY